MSCEASWCHWNFLPSTNNNLLIIFSSKGRTLNLYLADEAFLKTSPVVKSISKSEPVPVGIVDGFNCNAEPVNIGVG